jgi:hypothetical protein
LNVQAEQLRAAVTESFLAIGVSWGRFENVRRLGDEFRNPDTCTCCARARHVKENEPAIRVAALASRTKAVNGGPQDCAVGKGHRAVADDSSLNVN